LLLEDFLSYQKCSLQSTMKKIHLVLLPGLDGTEILFGPLIRHLPPWIQPHIISYPTSGKNSYEELLEAVDSEVSRFEHFAILGSSFGGPLSLMIAARHSPRVSAILLCASFVTPPRPELVRFRLIARTPVIGVLRALRRIRFVIPGLASDELRRAKAKLWNRVGARVLASRSRAVLRVDVRSQLRDVAVPLMYLAFTNDTVVPRRCLEEVVSIAPLTHVAEIEGEHLGLFTHPKPSAEFIADFLAISVLPRSPAESATV